MKQTHKSRLLDYLKTHKTITSLEAIRDLGNTRLADSVFRLKKDGHFFSTKNIQVPNRYGSTTKVAEYTLVNVS